jgi:hypothetical protein
MKTFVKTITFMLFVLTLSCHNKSQNENDTIISTGQFKLNPILDSLAHEFIKKANCPNCYYEMYIDKRDQFEHLIIFGASLAYPNNIYTDKEMFENYIKTNRTIGCVKIDNVVFFIYTGIEDLVIPITYNYNIKFKKSKREYYDYFWTIKKINNEYKVYENTYTNPFVKLEFEGVIEFKAPLADSTIKHHNSKNQR